MLDGGIHDLNWAVHAHYVSLHHDHSPATDVEMVIIAPYTCLVLINFASLPVSVLLKGINSATP
jgi:hypothetical protein